MRLVIMAKAAVAGRAKTRLAKEIGVGRAASFARTGGLACIRRLASDPRWKSFIAVTPDAAMGEAIWPRGVRRVPQGHGDLGARMQRVFDRLPPGPVIIVGTDIPRIAPSHVARAFRLLGGKDVVLGPAGDGGYWLVGLNRRPRRIAPFANVRWSSRHALGDTKANLGGLKVALADQLDDVDDAASLARNANAVGRVVLPRRSRQPLL
jgi:rSAM/selenodomain-associated transferase 1